MVENSRLYACVYLAQEDSYNTYGVARVILQRNTLKNCGSTSTGHGTILLFTSGQDANSDVNLLRNDIVQSRHNGIRVFGPQQTNIRVESNRVHGAGTSIDITSAGVTLVPFVSGLVGGFVP